MSDRIATAAARLNTRLKACAATTLTYRCGTETLQIAMTLGGQKDTLLSILASTPGVIDATVQTPENAVRSFAFDAADLDFGDGLQTPQAGDEVLETVGSSVHVFRVMAPPNGQLAWEWQTEHRQEGARFLVHTQLVSTNG